MSDKQPIHPLLVGTTPGPWQANRLRDNSGDAYATLYQAHIDLGVCMVWAPDGNAEQEANAKLIAAAPSLAAENAALADQVERLSKALKPFAEFGAAWIRMPAGSLPDDRAVYAIHGSTEYAAEITLGQLKEAHRTLSSLNPR